MKQKEKSIVVTGFIWKFLERIMAQSVSFIVSIILARLLLPTDYGIVTLVLVFITIANVFVSSGFGDALIQKKDADEVDFSTLFYCSLIVAFIIYLLLFFGASIIANFYRNRALIPVIRIMALKIPISSISTVQHAYVSKQMQFKKFFFSTLGGTLVSGVVGIILAHNGAGVWALVAQYLTNTIIDTTVLFFTMDWRPRIVFSVNSAKELMRNAWKLTGSAFINTVYSQLYNLVIGRVFSADQLAFYSKGNQFPSLFITNIDASISSVIFPVLVNARDSHERLKQLSKKNLKISCYCVFPLLVGLSVISSNLVEVILTNKWAESSFFLVIGCIVFMFQPLQTVNWQVIKAVGKNDWCLKLEILKKVVGISILGLSIPFGIKIVVTMSIINAMFSTLVNMSFCNKVIHYSLIEQIMDVLEPLFLSCLMGSIVYLCGLINIPIVLRLIFQVLIGLFSYSAFSFVFRNECFFFIRSFIRNMRRSI